MHLKLTFHAKALPFIEDQYFFYRFSLYIVCNAQIFNEWQCIANVFHFLHAMHHKHVYFLVF